MTRPGKKIGSIVLIVLVWLLALGLVLLVLSKLGMNWF